MIADGTVRPVIDRTYTLDEIIQAHAYVDSGRKTGSVAVTVAQDNGDQAKCL